MLSLVLRLLIHVVAKASKPVLLARFPHVLSERVQDSHTYIHTYKHTGMYTHTDIINLLVALKIKPPVFTKTTTDTEGTIRKDRSKRIKRLYRLSFDPLILGSSSEVRDSDKCDFEIRIV